MEDILYFIFFIVILLITISFELLPVIAIIIGIKASNKNKKIIIYFKN